MKSTILHYCIFLIIGLTLSSCKKHEPDENQDHGHLRFVFQHYVDGEPLVKDSMKYVNAAGNPYEINDLMYFISDVTLYKSGQASKVIDDWKSIDYIDISMPETLTWEVFDEIPTGSYDSISFIFGINEEKNKSFIFVNPPEVNMMWPDILGGGYHYMMLNGRWKDLNHVEQLFSDHLGIGQLYKSNVIEVDSIYAFVQNYFKVCLPGSAILVEKDKIREVTVRMNIESWYITPHIFDHNVWGGAIMQNQPAMQTLKENGSDVFSITGIQ